jgi:CelD/BcsL family acetyltransferase involved in cellulose biosynthesis
MSQQDPSQSTGDKLHVTIVKDEPVFDSVLDDWSRLCETTENPNLFIMPHWVQTWWRHFHEEASPRIFVYYDELGPKGLFPLMLGRKPIDGLRANVLGFMTNEESTKPQWLVRGDPGPVIRRWVADLATETDWDVLDLVSLPADTDGLDVLPEVLDAHGLRWTRRPGQGASILDVTGDFEDYWQGRSRNLRKGLRNRENRLGAGGELQLEISRPDDDPNWWLDRIFNVASHTWKAARRTSLADGKRRLFFADEVKELLPSGQALVFVASLDEVDIAYDLTFVHRGFLYDLKTDYHQDFRDLAPGMLLVKHMIEYGCADPDIHTIDFITDPDWLRRWTETVAESVHLRIFNRTLTGRTIGILEKNLRPLGRAVKRMIRRERPS